MSRSVFIPILAVAFLVAFIIDTSYFNVPGSVILLSMGVLLPILFVFYKDKNNDIRRVYFRPIHIFLLSFVIVYFQKPVDILLGYVSDYYMIGRIDLMPECVKVSLLGLISFLMGYIIKNDDRASKGGKEQNYFSPASTTIYKVLTSLFILIILIAVPKNVLFGGYHSAALNNSLYNYLASWCGVFYCAFFIQYSINMKAKGIGKGWTIGRFMRDIGWWLNINMFIFLLIILNL